MKIREVSIESYWPINKKLSVIFTEKKFSKYDTLFVSVSTYAEIYYYYLERTKKDKINLFDVMGLDVIIDQDLNRKQLVLGLSSIKSLLQHEN